MQTVLVFDNTVKLLLEYEVLVHVRVNTVFTDINSVNLAAVFTISN